MENTTQKNDKNPFVKAFANNSWNTPDNAIPFDQLHLNDYIPAVQAGIETARANIAKVKNNPAAADFKNTIVALEEAAEMMEAATGVYFNLFSAEASTEMQALAKEISPIGAAFSSEVNLDADLFARVNVVYSQMAKLGLNSEDKMLLEKTYRGFTRNGALLNSQDKEKLRQIDQELSVLGPQFSEHVLKATNLFEMLLTDKKDLAGLPESAVESAAADAKQKNKTGWLFTLQAPSFIPFMQYSTRSDLREKLWRAYSSRALEGDTSNKKIIMDMIRLRTERAQLLGYKNHAAITLTERMAETPERVFTFLNQLLDVVQPAAVKDVAELRDFAQKLDGTKEVKPWDVAYYSEKLREEKFKFSDEELRPYFQLENVVQGVFAHAQKLYGLQFKKRTDIPLYHPDVNAYEVVDAKNQYIGLFYTDFFPRETKKSGAWMTEFRGQGQFMGEVRRPHVSIVCNFTKPTLSKPSLLTYDEVKTLFHEFGHALHGLLSNVHHRSLSGPNVYWDFVELPSQVMENWVGEKEGLDVFAKHFETGAPIPADLVQKIRDANTFQAGYGALRQLTFAILDMAWHTADPQGIQDVTAFELQATARTRLFEYVPGTGVSTSFSHIFAGGYSAGYYSYKWAEVLDADAFEYFKEKGIFNAEVAAKFRENILSKGGTEHPMELYKKFRGREPDPNALLRRDGLL